MTDKYTFLPIPGHLYESEGFLLQTLASDKCVLEIGTYHGRSTVAMASTAIAVDSVDSYLGDDMLACPALESVTRATVHGLTENVVLYRSNFMEFLQDTDISIYDMIFYDGPHSPPLYEKQFLEFMLARQYRGQIVVHDYKPNEPAFAHTVKAIDDYAAASGREMQGPAAGTSIVWFEAV